MGNFNDSKLEMFPRYEWADFVRGLLMIFVFIYHSEVYYYHEHSLSWIFVPFFLTGFFFISGFLFSRNIRELSIKGKVKQVFRGIVFPYVVFEMTLVVPKVLAGRSEALHFILDIILFRGSWFVIAIGVMQLLYAIVLKSRHVLMSLIGCSIVFFVLGIFLCCIYNPDSLCYNDVVQNQFLFSHELPNRLPFCLNLALLNCPFFALGIYCRMHNNFFMSHCTKPYLILSIVLYVLLYCLIDHLCIGSFWNGATGKYHNLLLMILYAVLGIWVTCCFSIFVESFGIVNYIGRNSIIFAFLNGGALVFASSLIKKIVFFESSNYLCQISVALIALLIVYMITVLISRYAPILRGDKNAFNNWSRRIGLNIIW